LVPRTWPLHHFNKKLKIETKQLHFGFLHDTEHYEQIHMNASFMVWFKFPKKKSRNMYFALSPLGRCTYSQSSRQCSRLRYGWAGREGCFERAKSA
jgi:hypothetical protein